MNTRILLVEDDERLAELTAEYLTKNDLQVSIEPRGDTAEARIIAESCSGSAPDMVNRKCSVRFTFGSSFAIGASLKTTTVPRRPAIAAAYFT
jgi:hypothetical protein